MSAIYLCDHQRQAIADILLLQPQVSVSEVESFKTLPGLEQDEVLECLTVIRNPDRQYDSKEWLWILTPEGQEAIAAYERRKREQESNQPQPSKLWGTW